MRLVTGVAVMKTDLPPASGSAPEASVGFLLRINAGRTTPGG